MPWYKTGTVSVTLNSNAVIGTGTAFIANSRVGDAFRGPDGAWYEVTNIASNTALSISPNYQGATNATGGYALAPMQGYVKDSADALRGITNTYGTKLAALGTTGNYDVLPVTKGGTGGADAASARVGLGLGSASNANIGTAPGQVMAVGTGGLYGSPGNAPILTDLYNINRRSLEMGEYGLVNGKRIPGAQSNYGLVLGIQGANSEWRHILQFTADGDVYDVSITNPSSGGQWRVAKFYTTLNTTRAADGTLKAI